jgi:hypothetical protein
VQINKIFLGQWFIDRIVAERVGVFIEIVGELCGNIAWANRPVVIFIWPSSPMDFKFCNYYMIRSQFWMDLAPNISFPLPYQCGLLSYNLQSLKPGIITARLYINSFDIRVLHVVKPKSLLP